MNSETSYVFKNKKFLETALTHRSYLNEHKRQELQSNERLEYLGDAVLELITSLYLYRKYPDHPEGKLTALRAKLVQTKTLSLAAKQLGLGEKLHFSKGERQSGGDKNPSILADTFEALIGAVYEDGGFEPAYDFALQNLLLPAEKLFRDKLPFDFKSKLQEVVQAQGKASPVYQTISAIGPDHNKTFKLAVLIDGRRIVSGTGKSKQEAEQSAAKLVLKKINSRGLEALGIPTRQV